MGKPLRQGTFARYHSRRSDLLDTRSTCSICHRSGQVCTCLLGRCKLLLLPLDSMCARHICWLQVLGSLIWLGRSNLVCTLLRVLQDLSYHNTCLEGSLSKQNCQLRVFCLRMCLLDILLAWMIPLRSSYLLGMVHSFLQCLKQLGSFGGPKWCRSILHHRHLTLLGDPDCRNTCPARMVYKLTHHPCFQVAGKFRVDTRVCCSPTLYP
jgi:hypothetical protein